MLVGYIKRFFDFIFYFPPMEKRKSFFKRIYLTLGSKFYSEKEDDIYTYYIMFSTVLVVNIAYILISLICFIFGFSLDLGFLSIDLTGDTYVSDFSYMHTHNMRFIIFALLLPYFILYALKNIPMARIDMLRHHNNISDEFKSKRIKVVGLFFLSSIVFSIIFINGYYLPVILMEYGVINNAFLSLITVMLFYLLFYPAVIFFSMSSIILLFSTVFFYQKPSNL